MGRAGGIPHQKRPLRIGQSQVAQVADGLIGQVGVEVVPLFRGGRRLDIGLVPDELGSPLVGLTVEKPVVVVETNPGGPCLVRPCGPLVSGGEVPLAHREGGPSIGSHVLGQGAGRVRDLAGVAGEVDGQVSEHAHPNPMVIAPGEQAGPGGRAHRGGVEVGEAQSSLGQPVEVGVSMSEP